MNVDWSEIVFVLVFAVWLLSLFHTLLTQRRLYRYLQGFHPDRWHYLISEWRQGGGARENSPRYLPYIFSDQDNDDQKVVVLKAAVKRSLVYFVCLLGAILLMTIAMDVSVLLIQKQLS